MNGEPTGGLDGCSTGGTAGGVAGGVAGGTTGGATEALVSRVMESGAPPQAISVAQQRRPTACASGNARALRPGRVVRDIRVVVRVRRRAVKSPTKRTTSDDGSGHCASTTARRCGLRRAAICNRLARRTRRVLRERGELLSGRVPRTGATLLSIRSPKSKSLGSASGLHREKQLLCSALSVVLRVLVVPGRSSPGASIHTHCARTSTPATSRLRSRRRLAAKGTNSSHGARDRGGTSHAVGRHTRLDQSRGARRGAARRRARRTRSCDDAPLRRAP